ncbi:uncharacterized protein LOC115381505 isoform X1 [Salarias fasciatus]|uniref:uncharacterized protein LOC115381505 isoform X1 n=1 Tax=Salarias fasciatus TaxID=181472 RepID=UPI0011765920|nr:uncharacterized protein LOC115381505 isoform X1 [Salarias fasciatus]
MVAARQKFIPNMKPWIRLCCLVLVISSTCRGQNGTVSPVEDEEMEGVNATTSEPFPQLEPTFNEDTNQSFPEPSSLSPALPGENVTSSEDDADVTTKGSGDATRGRTPPPPVTTVAMKTTSTSNSPPPAGGGSPSWAYVLLVLIILVIIALCVILYFLRKASKSYSFELQRPSPSNDLVQPTGTFEPVYLDDLERPNLKDLESAEEPPPPPVTNGTSLQLEAKDSSEDAASDNPPVLANGVETSPAGDGSGPTSGDDPVDMATDPLSSIDLLLDPVEQQQNENNNNPAVRSSDPFVEINLDESPWSDQLLASPEAPSSVLPFSPFSF